ncbi:unnamed protein product [Closterium sp. NIES-64]|nr:unnamed protein product [Closterium sp. NIES-64]
MVGSTGDAQATGQICLAVYMLDNDFNLFYNLTASTSKPGALTSALIARGPAGKAGQTLLEIVGAGATWTDVTPSLKGVGFQTTPAYYTLNIKGTWLKTSTLNVSDGKPVTNLIAAMMRYADTYYGQFATAAFKAGAARGQFQLVPIRSTPDGGANPKLVKVSDSRRAADGSRNGVVEAHLNGSNAGLAAATNSSGSLSLAVFHISILLCPLPSFSHPPPPLPILPSLSSSLILRIVAPPYAPAHPRPNVCPSLSLLVPPRPSLPLLAPPRPSLPLLAPPCLSLPLLVPPCPSSPLPCHPPPQQHHDQQRNDDILYSDAQRHK